MSDAEEVTVPQAAKMLGISRQHLHRLIESRSLTVVRVEPFPGGSRRWLKRSEIEQLANERERASS